jgi:sialic acid synthase SpsE
MKVKLIAEFCQNHNGNREYLKTMIYSAVKAGFTHAKIQGLYSNELNRREEFEEKGSPVFRPFDKEFERLKKLDLSEDDENWFVEESKRAGITPMITVFTHNGVERARQSGFTSIKIASYDCASIPLIRRVANFASELVVSTGATSWEDVKKTAQILKTFKKSSIEVALLHARTIYPTPSDCTGLARLLALREFNLPVGFSDHSRPDVDGLLATKFALVLGAEVVERHFTVLDKSQTKDGPVSINEAEAAEISSFAAMSLEEKMANLDNEILRLGEFIKLSNFEPSDVEIMNAKYYRGRVGSIINGKRLFGWDEIE